jgi:hypothetical protein
MTTVLIREGDSFSLYQKAACVAATRKKEIWMISQGATGRVLLPRPRHLEGCALVEFTPPPVGAPRKFFVRYDDMLLTTKI